MSKFAGLSILAAVAATALTGAHAQVSTVCTITVNSADEREAFRQSLPEDRFRFVELVERGRPDWLASACRQQIRCDLLIVSGHFAGTEFYSSRFDVNETLRVDEMERVQCSDSCPGLFSQLKEVYLFGCDTLKPEPVKSAAPEIVRGLLRAGQPRAQAERFVRALSERHGENSRDHMRRIFANVPVIYGFSALAPYGRTAGPLLDRFFESGSMEEIGTGRPSERLLGLFAPTNMTVASGLRETDPHADFRGESCRYFDERLSRAQKLGFIHQTLRGDAALVRMSFERIESFFASLPEGERGEAALSKALDALARDRTTRARYLALVRDTEDPALRVRMIALARTMGWISPAEQRAELVGLILDVLGASAVSYGEIDLICTLNRDRELDRELHRFKSAKLFPNKTAHAAAQACLGGVEARAKVLRALASPRDQDVRIAQAYLRHHPIADSGELRAVASGISRMAASPAQVRALETLARQHVSDRDILDELARLFVQATSVSVQRAIAEIFIRSDARGVGTPDLAGLLREHRLPSPEGQDLIDVLISRLQGS